MWGPSQSTNTNKALLLKVMLLLRTPTQNHACIPTSCSYSLRAAPSVCCALGFTVGCRPRPAQPQPSQPCPSLTASFTGQAAAASATGQTALSPLCLHTPQHTRNSQCPPNVKECSSSSASSMLTAPGLELLLLGFGREQLAPCWLRWSYAEAGLPGS